jgi:hypothetical protein
MLEKSQTDLEYVTVAGNGYVIRHPAWCHHTRCTANPASQANGYRAGAGGEHRSAPIPLDLTTALPLSTPAGEVYLTEAVAPWQCSTYLHIQVGDAAVSMPVEYAERVLSTLHMIVAAAQAGQAVTP